MVDNANVELAMFVDEIDLSSMRTHRVGTRSLFQACPIQARDGEEMRSRAIVQGMFLRRVRLDIEPQQGSGAWVWR